MQTEVVIDRGQLDAARLQLEGIRNGVPSAIQGALNDTGKREISSISKQIRERVNIKKKDIDPFLKRTFATLTRLESKLVLDKSGRLPLKYFGARQTTKGVSYKISKSGGRKVLPHAFGPNIPKLGRHVYMRAGDGKDRKKLIKLYGPSPWGVFVKADLDVATVADAQEWLRKNMDRRIALAVLRKTGKVK